MTTSGTSPSAEPSRFDPELAYTAAQLYYLAEATQAEIADRLGVSRPTVSRLIAEARRLGMVRIDIVRPESTAGSGLADGLAERLGLAEVRLAPRTQPNQVGRDLVPLVGSALTALPIGPGDVLLVSSGRTAYEISRGKLPPLPGVVVAPTVGGVAEPEAWYQTNEITRQFAERVLGRPRMLFAPAIPSESLLRVLREDPDFRSFTDHWERARAAIVGIGAPTLSRNSISPHVPVGRDELQRAVGDVSLNFYDHEGAIIRFPEAERIVAISPDQLRRIDYCIGVAAGAEKVQSIIAAARGRLINRLITDVPTAELMLERLE